MTEYLLMTCMNERAGISPEIAIRISKVFGTSAYSWLNQQVQYDLWVTEKPLGKMKVERLSAA